MSTYSPRYMMEHFVLQATEAATEATSSSDGGGLATLIVLALAAVGISLVFFFATRYKICPSDKVMVIYGRVGKGKVADTVHGGGRLILPLIQNSAFLDLKPMTINIDLKNALSMQNIRINVPSTFTIAISTQEAIMQNAAQRLLGFARNPVEIEELAREVIFGQLRLTVASLSIEQINTDREAFLDSIRTNVDTELNKVGLYLINVNVTDITDESNYIENIGKKAAAEANNQALVDVANSDKDGAIGKAQADRDRAVQVAENEAQAEKGRKAAQADQRIFVQEREAEAVAGENLSNARIAEVNAELAEREAEAVQRAEVARRIAETEIQKAQYDLEQERLRAESIVSEKISKEQIEIAAEAEAEKQRRIASGEADAILARYLAEAEGTQKVLEAKAQGYQALVSGAGNDPSAAATLLMIEKLEQMVAMQTEAIRNLKIDKVTVWDGGGNSDGSSSTSNFVSSLVQSLPPIHDVAKMAGVDLPEYLGKISPDDTPVVEN